MHKVIESQGSIIINISDFRIKSQFRRWMDSVIAQAKSSNTSAESKPPRKRRPFELSRVVDMQGKVGFFTPTRVTDGRTKDSEGPLNRRRLLSIVVNNPDSGTEQLEN